MDPTGRERGASASIPHQVRPSQTPTIPLVVTLPLLQRSGGEALSIRRPR